MAVKTYSLKKDGEKNLSPNFKVKEFRSRDGADKILIEDKLVTLLQKMRDKFGPISISSAYRTATYNKKVGGVSGSQHLYGLAADITFAKSSPAILEEAAKYAQMIGFTGIGLDSKYQMYMHLDTRPSPSYFRYNSSNKSYSVSGFLVTLKKGSKGDEVKTLQTKLKNFGYKGKDGKELTCDGDFGNNTEYALKNFQKAKGLTVDGIAGPKTWAKL